MGRKFARGCLVYALVVLILGGVGLAVLWNFLRAYEDSRSQYAVSAFMDGLTEETVLQGVEAQLREIDPNLQSRASAEQVVRTACAQGFQAVKDSAASTDTVLRYRIRSGKTTLGSFTLTAENKGTFGFPQWSVTNSEYDVSALYGPPVSVTVDSRAQVLSEGTPLPESDITERDIPYALFTELASAYDFPTRVTYTVEGYLGTLSLRVLDRNGRNVTGENYETVFLEDNCDETEIPLLQQTLENFVKRYIAFSGSTKASARGNLGALRRLIASDSPLYARLASALDGLSFGQSVRDQLTDLQYNHLIRLDEDTYFCDVTYLVDTTGKKGVVQTTNHLKLLLVQEGGSLKVREMSSY